MPKFTVESAPVSIPSASTSAVAERQAEYNGIIEQLRTVPALVFVPDGETETLQMIRNNLSRAAKRANVEISFAYFDRKADGSPIAIDPKHAPFMQASLPAEFHVSDVETESETESDGADADADGAETSQDGADGGETESPAPTVKGGRKQA